jgi:multidrug resistance efflux pump
VPVERCVVKAPFAGVVVTRLARPHESVTAGQQLLTILDDSRLEVRVVVPSVWLRWLEPGMRFVLHVDETARQYDAVLDRIGARVDPVSQTVEIFGSLTERPPELVVGMSGSALFPRRPEPGAR